MDAWIMDYRQLFIHLGMGWTKAYTHVMKEGISFKYFVNEILIPSR